METAYIGDFILAYISEMTLGSKVTGSYYPNEVCVFLHKMANLGMRLCMITMTLANALSGIS